MENTNEALLNSWLRISTSINNPRLVTDLTFNESLVCNILYQHHHNPASQSITATDLCRMTNMLKSQMNRTLTQLEIKGMITRERSPEDKRQIFITMNLDQCHVYEQQHERILKILDAVISKLGTEKSKTAIDIFNTISDIAEELNLGK